MIPNIAALNTDRIKYTLGYLSMKLRYISGAMAKYPVRSISFRASSIFPAFLMLGIQRWNISLSGPFSPRPSENGWDMHALFLQANHHMKFNSQQEKNVVLPNTTLNASTTAAIPLCVGVLNTTVRSHQLKLWPFESVVFFLPQPLKIWLIRIYTPYDRASVYSSNSLVLLSKLLYPSKF